MSIGTGLGEDDSNLDRGGIGGDGKKLIDLTSLWEIVNN